MAGISVIGLERDPFLHYQDQSEEFRSALDSRVGASITCRMPEVTAEAVANSSKEMARFAIFPTGKGKAPSCQLLQPQHLCRKVDVREVEMGRGSGRHHHPGEREDRKKDLAPLDVSSKRSRSSNERPQLQSLTTSGEPR
jgi:hypothetical protein